MLDGQPCLGSLEKLKTVFRGKRAQQASPSGILKGRASPPLLGFPPPIPRNPSVLP